MYHTQTWIRLLHSNGFICKRKRGGHARFACGSISVDLPIHKKELSRIVIASIKRALRLKQTLEVSCGN